MKKKIIIGMISVILVIGCFMISCGSSDTLIGGWKIAPGQPPEQIEDLQILEDGTIFVDNTMLKWKTEEKRFYISTANSTFSWLYKLKGKNLTLTDDNGNVLKFIKYPFLFDTLDGTEWIMPSFGDEDIRTILFTDSKVIYNLELIGESLKYWGVQEPEEAEYTLQGDYVSFRFPSERINNFGRVTEDKIIIFRSRSAGDIEEFIRKK